jgi:hypothetical protein
VVCALSHQKAKVTVVGGAGEVELMRRDLELLGAVVTLAPLERIDATEARLVADNLRASGQLPSVVVCCGPGIDAAATVLVKALQPTLELQLIKTRPGAGAGVFGVVGFGARSLAALLDDPGFFDPARPLSQVRLCDHLFHVRRREHVFAAPAARRESGRPTEPSMPARRPAEIRQALRPDPTLTFQQGDQA